MHGILCACGILQQKKPIEKAAEAIAMAWMELVMLAIAGEGIGQRSLTQNTKN